MDILKKDVSFLPDLSPLYNLVISVDGNSFQKFITDGNHQKILFFSEKNFPANTAGVLFSDLLKETADNDEFLKLSYKDVSVIWNSQSNTLVPEVLYDEKEKRNYLNFNRNINESEIVIAEKLGQAASYNIFGLPAPIRQVFDHLNPAYHHHISFLVESVLLHSKISGLPVQVFINVHHGFFDMVVVENQQLIFCNTFEFSAAEDFIYFVLFGFQQLRLNTNQIPVLISGKIIQDSPVYDMLMKYLRYVEFAPQPALFSSSPLTSGIHAHLHYVLFQSVLCGL